LGRAGQQLADELAAHTHRRIAELVEGQHLLALPLGRFGGFGFAARACLVLVCGGVGVAGLTLTVHDGTGVFQESIEVQPCGLVVDAEPQRHVHGLFDHRREVPKPFLGLLLRVVCGVEVDRVLVDWLAGFAIDVADFLHQHRPMRWVGDRCLGGLLTLGRAKVPKRNAAGVPPGGLLIEHPVALCREGLGGLGTRLGCFTLFAQLGHGVIELRPTGDLQQF
jgi:hypothetical protein